VAGDRMPDATLLQSGMFAAVYLAVGLGRNVDR